MPLKRSFKSIFHKPWIRIFFSFQRQRPHRLTQHFCKEATTHRDIFLPSVIRREAKFPYPRIAVLWEDPRQPGRGEEAAGCEVASRRLRRAQASLPLLKGSFSAPASKSVTSLTDKGSDHRGKEASRSLTDVASLAFLVALPSDRGDLKFSVTFLWK